MRPAANRRCGKSQFPSNQGMRAAAPIQSCTLVLPLEVFEQPQPEIRAARDMSEALGPSNWSQSMAGSVTAS